MSIAYASVSSVNASIYSEIDSTGAPFPAGAARPAALETGFPPASTAGA